MTKFKATIITYHVFHDLEYVLSKVQSWSSKFDLEFKILSCSPFQELRWKESKFGEVSPKFKFTPGMGEIVTNH